jgi:hypothetical protein
VSRLVTGNARFSEADVWTFGNLTSEILAQMDAARLPSGASAGLHVERSSFVALDAVRARPHRARAEKTIRIAGAVESEIKDAAFDWERSVGCGK